MSGTRLRFLPPISVGTVLAVCVGALLGGGGYAFHYGEGTSYLSNDPAACANCHVMNEQYDGWQKSSHHAVATCNDCHVPHDLAGKYLTKAVSGYLHSKAFTLQDFHEPIRMRPASRRTLTANCIACHEEVVHHLSLSASRFGEVGDCLGCHRSVGHGPTW